MRGVGGQDSFGTHETRSERDYGYLVRPEFQCHSVSHACGRVFHDVVVEVQEVFVAVPSNRVDDETPPAVEHQRHGEAAGGKVRPQPAREHGVPVFKAGFPKGRPAEALRVSFVAAPDVVHQQVDRGLLGPHARKQPIDLGLVGVIANHGERSPAPFGDFGRHTFERRMVPSREINGSSGIA